MARDEDIEERLGEKVKRYKALCNLRGLTFVPIIFTTSGGIGGAFQRQIRVICVTIRLSYNRG